MKKYFTELSPQEAFDLKLQLPSDDVQGPLTQEGKECPWPWDPIQLKGAPLGQYHCPYCGEMVLAGVDHIDYNEEIK